MNERKDELNAVESQHLLIEVGKLLNQEAVSEIARELNQSNICEELKTFISKCFSAGKQMSSNPEYCSSFDSTCRAIIARQTEIKVTKASVIRGFETNRVQYQRWSDGTSQITISNIRTICSKFKKEADRRFWEIQMLYFLPSAQFFDLDKGNQEANGKELISHLEYEGLQFVAKMLTEKDWESLKAEISKKNREDWEKLEIVRGDKIHTGYKSRIGNTSLELYKTICSLCRESGMTVEHLVVEELGLSMNSWYAWENKWKEAAMRGFQFSSGRQSCRLQRWHLLIIAAVFQLEYWDMVKFLQLGGYRFGASEVDRQIADYFLHKPEAPKTKDEAEKKRKEIVALISANRMDKIG